MTLPTRRKTPDSTEFGDFQTPPELAAAIASLLSHFGIAPASLVEPTCGRGNLLFAVCDTFGNFKTAFGMDISPEYVAECRARAACPQYEEKVAVRGGDFFDTNWTELLASLPEPILLIGNPPWVTSAGIGVVGGTNLPVKTNLKAYTGLDAITGKSNFDISEWMLIRALHGLRGRQGTIAMLVKTSVARKVLEYAWKQDSGMSRSAIYLIDAAKHFNAAVDACLFVGTFSSEERDYNCAVYNSFDGGAAPSSVIGWCDGEMVADRPRYEKWKHLRGESFLKWRSGVKHDCSKVMEFRRTPVGFVNGFGEQADIEDTFVFPLLKTSDVAKGLSSDARGMLVTQRFVGEDTTHLQTSAPKTWAYLEQHGDRMDARSSSIYKNRSRFSVFGVGDYTFAPWKVATSGFYKRLSFMVAGPVNGKPVVLDDASYFIGCQSQEEAEFIASLLDSPPAREFLSAFIFWDAKRPITADILRRLDLAKLACELGQDDILQGFAAPRVR